ncbi:MAG: hypothetical protein AB1489_42350, partial [Acidobacteriota bacterium]
SMRKNIALSVSLFVCLVFALTMAASTNSNTNSSKAAPLPVNPREEATVSMTFDGLMALCMGNPERVSVGILDVHHHTPMLAVSKIVNGRKTTLATLKGEQLRGTIYIDVEGASAQVGRYLAPSMQNDPNDFRWNIDMEGDLHQRELHLKEEKLFGKIHIGAGLFYAHNISEEKVRFFAADGSGKALPFNRQVAEPAAKINLAKEQVLVIRGDKEAIQLTVEPSTRYEVALTNLPPEEMANMDHFLFYYDFMAVKVSPYMPESIRKIAFAPRPLVCGSVVFSRSQLD